MSKTGMLVSLILIGLSSLQVQGAPRPAKLRLIETAPGQRSWMSEREIAKLSADRHDVGKCGGFFDVPDQAEAPPVPSSKSAFKPRVPHQQQTLEPLLPLVAPDR